MSLFLFLEVFGSDTCKEVAVLALERESRSLTCKDIDRLSPSLLFLGLITGLIGEFIISMGFLSSLTMVLLVTGLIVKKERYEAGKYVLIFLCDSLSPH
jgi:hypothetical protein